MCNLSQVTLTDREKDEGTLIVFIRILILFLGVFLHDISQRFINIIILKIRSEFWSTLLWGNHILIALEALLNRK